MKMEDGYRQLEDGEVLRAGDEFCDHHGNWETTIGHTIGAKVGRVGYARTYRRVSAVSGASPATAPQVSLAGPTRIDIYTNHRLRIQHDIEWNCNAIRQDYIKDLTKPPLTILGPDLSGEEFELTDEELREWRKSR